MANKPLPPTRDGFRYYLGEDDEVLCRNYIHMTRNHDSLKRLNLSFIRKKILHPHVKLSENDRAPQIKLEGDFRVTGEKGYCMVRATHSVNRGKFYYEVTIDAMDSDKTDETNKNSATRIGWGQKFANLQAPLGYDKYGYSYRSRFGTKFHQAKGKTFDKDGGYGSGDTIGCMIELPYGNEMNITEGHHLPVSIKATGYVVNFKKKDSAPKILEEKDEPPAKMKPLIGSKISFYKNGKFIGDAFEDIFEGYYYPTVSLYKNCTVTVNFGPKFRYPPPQPERMDCGDDDRTHLAHWLQWRPMSEMAEIAVIDNLVSDMLYILEQENDPSGNKLEQMIKKGLMN